MTKHFALLLTLLLACRIAIADTSTNVPATNAPPATNHPAASLSILPAQKLLPDDTLVMFTIPDFNKAREIYQHSPQGQLWNDPAMKDFKEKFFAKFSTNVIAPLEHELGIHMDDYASLPQGQFTLAFIQNDWQGKDGQPAFLLLLDSKDKSPQLKADLDDLKKKWANAGKTIHTETIRDVDFSVIAASTADFIKLPKKTGPMGPGLPEPMPIDTKDKPKRAIYIGQVNSLLIVGDSSKVIEKVLARMGGGSVSVLSDLAAFDGQRALFHDAPVFGWVNTKALMDIVNRSSDTTDADAAANPFAFQPHKIFAGLGLNGLNAAAFNCRFSDDGSEFNVALSVPEANRAGVLKILAGEAKDCNPPVFVPADAVKFQRWRFDGPKTWATIRKTVGDISGPALGGIDFVLSSVETAAKEKDPSFDLNKNLFGNIGGDIVTYEKTPKDPTQPNSAPAIFFIGSPNPEQLVDAIKRVLALVASQQTGTPTEREFLGHKIYTFPLPAAPNSSSPAGSLSYTCSSSYIALSPDAALLEEYLRSLENPAKALRDTPGLGDALQKVTGSGTSLLGYGNEAENMRVSFEAMRTNPDAPDPLLAYAPILTLMNVGEMKGKDWMDLSLLPPFEKISKYFYITVYSGSTTPDSINFKVFAPTPPQLRK